ncbi:hypothetical protein KC340_g10826 [Hortaea werneckii]|nr:hypothetical protein KC361_g9496 [Hortaea werneckii]KAI6809489.1 hypothetical protein KC342_g18339 [Hortaea werneckii]KAI6853521.1 hypothetical protein KC323_g9325 [Hortaea werneckii]KAI6863464.1 hypothetical protein KC338_g5892 [Hortaea werneckii]KAI7058887.1 hypothetical protein KC339_g17520 [Hortaea werneckii]
MSPSGGICSLDRGDCGPIPYVPYEIVCCLLTLDPRRDVEEQLRRKDLPARMRNAYLICHPDKCRNAAEDEQAVFNSCTRLLTDLHGFLGLKVSAAHQLHHLGLLPRYPKLVSPFWLWDVTASVERGRFPLDDNFHSLDPELAGTGTDPTAISKAYNDVAMQKERNKGRWRMGLRWLDERKERETMIDELLKMRQEIDEESQRTKCDLARAREHCDQLEAALAESRKQSRELRKERESLKNYLGAEKQRMKEIRVLVSTSACGWPGFTPKATHADSHDAVTLTRQESGLTINADDSPAAGARKRAQEPVNGGPSKRQKTSEWEDDKIVVE